MMLYKENETWERWKFTIFKPHIMNQYGYSFVKWRAAHLHVECMCIYVLAGDLAIQIHSAISLNLFSLVAPRSYSVQCFVSDSIVGARLTRKMGWPRKERLGKIGKERERERDSLEKNSLRSELWAGDQSAPWSPAAFVTQCTLASANAPPEVRPNVSCTQLPASYLHQLMDNPLPLSLPKHFVLPSLSLV